MTPAVVVRLFLFLRGSGLEFWVRLTGLRVRISETDQRIIKEGKMKKLVLISAMLLGIGVVTLAHAATFEMRGYLETLPQPYPEQSSDNLWTFHNKDHNEALLPPSPNSYRAYETTGSIIGQLVITGSPEWYGYDGIYSNATFDGVFVHSGIEYPTVAVFHAPQSMNIYEIKLTSEMVAYGVPTGSFDVTVNSVISGVTKKIGSYTVSGRPMLETTYTSLGMSLQTGDMIEILYGNDGDYHHDHGNMNVFIVTYNPISIDISPADGTNTIDLLGMETIPVAILSSGDFDAPKDVNPATLNFGPTGGEQSLVNCARKGKDVNGDGLRDLVCTFSTKAAGFQCGNTEGVLKGKTKAGTVIEGRDLVRIVPCK